MIRALRLDALLIALCISSASLLSGQSSEQSRGASISAAEFSRLSQSMSEKGGFFQSDNLISNETSYLHIVPKLKQLGIGGGAYLGVGPEQNFTYIAKLHPSIAFIVDIRREAIIQHLMYKALFHLAKDRAEFLSLLVSKPLSANRAEAKGTLIDLMNYLYQASSSRDQFNKNLNIVRQTIEHDFQFPLTSEDLQTLSSVYYAFWRYNLAIAWGPGFPNLGDMILETDLDGKQGNFLISEDDYQFVRNLQELNRVIPVVGDFGGTKALAAVAHYLTENGYTVSAFYTSNVEEYLYQGDSFTVFVENVRKLPADSKSVIIRSVKGSFGHPAAVPGYRMVQLLEEIPLFLKDYDLNRYASYRSLVTTHYIAGSRSASATPEQAKPRGAN